MKKALRWLVVGRVYMPPLMFGLTWILVCSLVLYTHIVVERAHVRETDHRWSRLEMMTNRCHVRDVQTTSNSVVVWCRK